MTPPRWLKKPNGNRTQGSSTERVSVAVKGLLKASKNEARRDALLAGLGIGLLPDVSVPAGDALVEVLRSW